MVSRSMLGAPAVTFPRRAGAKGEEYTVVPDVGFLIGRAVPSLVWFCPGPIT
jgi:hypothetical protein